jgi:hypothetical protein
MNKLICLTHSILIILTITLTGLQQVQADQSAPETCTQGPTLEPDYQTPPPANGGYEPVPVTSPSESPGLFPAHETRPVPNVLRYECLANNTNCSVFYAIDSDPNYAQDAAMRLCFSYGFPCRPLGCHRLP